MVKVVCINRGLKRGNGAKDRGPKGRDREVGFLKRGQRPPSHQLEGLGSAVSSQQGLEPRKKLVLLHFGVSKITNFDDFD